MAWSGSGRAWSASRARARYRRRRRHRIRAPPAGVDGYWQAQAQRVTQLPISPSRCSRTGDTSAGCRRNGNCVAGPHPTCPKQPAVPPASPLAEHQVALARTERGGAPERATEFADLLENLFVHGLCFLSGSRRPLNLSEPTPAPNVNYKCLVGKDGQGGWAVRPPVKTGHCCNIKRNSG